MTTRRGRTRRPGGHRATAIATALVAVLLVSASGLLVARSLPRELMAPAGPWPVGRAIVSLAGHTPAEAGRVVWIWYPAARAGVPDPYVPGPWRAGEPAVLGRGAVVQDLDAVRAHAAADVDVAPGRQWPLVVLTPGLGVGPWLYTTLAEGLAASGHVVVETVPNTTPWSVRDGRPVAADAARPRSDDELVAEQAMLIRATVDAVADPSAWRDPNPVAGRVTTSSVVFVGHSLGGAASLEACRVDVRCLGAVDLDGAVHGGVARAGLARPALVIGAEDTCAGEPVCATPGGGGPLPGPVTAPRYVVTVTGSRHMDFTDSGQLFVAPPFRSAARVGSIDGSRMAVLVGGLVTGFVDEVVDGQGRMAELARSPVPELRWIHAGTAHG